MTKRLNIAVSEELYNKTKSFKKKFNISKICQQAIQSAIKKHEMELERLKITSA